MQTRPSPNAIAATALPRARVIEPAGVGLASTGARDLTEFAVGTALAAAIVLTMAAGSTQLTLIACLAAIAGAIVSPAVGVIVLAVIVPLKSPGVLPIPGINTFLVGGLLLGCLYRSALDRQSIRVTGPFLLVAAFVTYAFAQQVPEMLGGWQGDVGHDVGYQIVQLLTGLGAIVGLTLGLRGRSPWPFLAASLVGACTAALLAIATLGSANPPAPIASLVNVSEDLARAVGPFGNPNYLGQYMATAVVLAVGLALVRGRPWIRILALVALPVVAGGLIVSLSRGGMIAVFAGILALGLTRGRRAALAVLAIGIPIAVVVFEVLLAERQGASGTLLGASGVGLAESNEGRLSAVLEAPRLFLTNPVFGIGLGQYRYESEAGSVAHNWYSSVLAEQGLFGIVTWGTLLVWVAMILRGLPTDRRSVGMGILGAVVVGSLFLELPTSFQTALLPAGVITAALVADWGPNRRIRPRRRTSGVRSSGAARPAPMGVG